MYHISPFTYHVSSFIRQTTASIPSVSGPPYHVCSDKTINYLVFNGICSNLSESKICIQSNKLTVHASIYPHAFVLPSFCLFVFLFTCYVRLPPLGSVYPSVRPSVYLSIHHSLLNDLAFRLCDHLKYNPTNSTNFKAFLFTSATF